MSKIWSKDETLWSFALYGTAVGAGTLFLPIQLGSAGAIVLFITALVAWPLTYWPHKALCQFILSSKTSAGEGLLAPLLIITARKSAVLLPRFISLRFCRGINLCCGDYQFLTEQLAKHIQIDIRIRMAVSFGVVLILNMIFLMGRHATLRVMGFLVFPLIAYFLFLSLYLTGSWQPSLLTGQMSLDSHTLHQVWISIPVMVFALAIRPLFRRLPSTDGKILAIRPWINAKDHEGRLPDYLPERAILCL